MKGFLQPEYAAVAGHAIPSRAIPRFVRSDTKPAPLSCLISSGTPFREIALISSSATAFDDSTGARCATILCETTSIVAIRCSLPPGVSTVPSTYASLACRPPPKADLPA